MSSAGVEGVNLQQAAHMILLDVPWSWGDLIQLVGRMVRMASPHSACTLHIMAARGTIDEYTIEVLKGKKGVFEAILGIVTPQVFWIPVEISILIPEWSKAVLK